MNTDVAAPSVTLPPAVDQFLGKLRKQGIAIQYAEPQFANMFDIGLSNFPAGFPFQLGRLAAMLERLLPNICSLMEIQFGSPHHTLGHKCSISLSVHCRLREDNTHE